MFISKENGLSEICQIPSSGSFHYVAAVDKLLQGLVGLSILQFLHHFITESLPHRRLHATHIDCLLTINVHSDMTGKK